MIYNLSLPLLSCPLFPWNICQQFKHQSRPFLWTKKNKQSPFVFSFNLLSQSLKLWGSSQTDTTKSTPGLRAFSNSFVVVVTIVLASLPSPKSRREEEKEEVGRSANVKIRGGKREIARWLFTPIMCESVCVCICEDAPHTHIERESSRFQCIFTVSSLIRLNLNNLLH